MKYVEGAQLVIAGDGDIKRDLERMVQREGLGEKVFFRGRLPLEELWKLTAGADLGVSVEEDVGLNYRYALPNKLFDYIQARVPVLVTRLPEMAAIVDHYQIGLTVDSPEPRLLAEAIKIGLFDPKRRRKWIANLEKAAADLTWEKEERVLREIFESFRK